MSAVDASRKHTICNNVSHWFSHYTEASNCHSIFGTIWLKVWLQWQEFKNFHKSDNYSIIWCPRIRVTHFTITNNRSQPQTTTGPFLPWCFNNHYLRVYMKWFLKPPDNWVCNVLQRVKKSFKSINFDIANYV